MAQFIYTMNRVGKVVPPKRHILKNISLSFFPGAKIGVLGLNGAGKSTLLRIMAGIDTEIEGEARPQPGIKIGYLPQEPKLDPEQTVREAVEEAVGDDGAAWLAWMRSMRPTPTRMRILTSWPANRASWKPSSPPRVVTTWRTNWSARPTPCAYRPGTPRSSTSPGVSAAG